MMIFPLNLAVNAMQPVSQVGNYVYYSAGSAGGADQSIKVKTDGGDEYTLMPGQGFRLDGRNFNLLMVSNAANAATILGKLLIADGGFFDNRVTGSVEVVDGGKNRTMAGGAFIGGYSIAPGAGNKACVQLWNPVGSGKNIIVGQLSCNVGGADAFYIYGSAGNAMTVINNGNSKRIGGAASVAQVQSAGMAAITPIGGMTNPLLTFNIAAGSVQLYTFKEPIVIAPGYGLIGMAGTIANNAGASFEWYEESV